MVNIQTTLSTWGGWCDFNQLNLSATQLVGHGSALEEELKVHDFIQWLNIIILSYLTASISFCVISLL